MVSEAGFRIPDYSGACIANVVPSVALSLARNRNGDGWPSESRVRELIRDLKLTFDTSSDSWVPKAITEANQVVLLVVDGLGTEQLAAFSNEAPLLASLPGTTICSVAPTTTATALTSITSGLSPLDHGIVGYRMRLGHDQVFNTLRWTYPDFARRPSSPGSICLAKPFMGLDVPAVSKAQYTNTGFTRAYLGDTRLHEFRTLSTMVSKVASLLQAGRPFVYTYYEGLDTVAHEYGFADPYLRELRFLDFLLNELIAVLPRGAALVVTADHGQVVVPDPPLSLDPRLEALTVLKSGEGRFRWLHLRRGELPTAEKIAKEVYSQTAVVMSREEVLDTGLFGPDHNEGRAHQRLGDLALIATAPVAFLDPADSGPFNLVSRHGALTSAELDVPLVGHLAV
ncbi:MAG: alkaline phosphatase family protein [Actinomycetota bacterium]|nr:alkaline phosphatase family protein [Actinomycetota bacterium]